MQILYSENEIQNRIAQLAKEISLFYQNKDLTVIAVLNGAILFAADLVRKLDLDCYLDCVAVESYQNNQSCGQINFRCKEKLPIKNRHVLLLDTVLDSGLTLKTLSQAMLKDSALSVRSCVLTKKNRNDGVSLHEADWVAFKCADLYLAGYGMDSNELYRNLPYIVAINE